jgi:peptidyl-dipeptidase Dcp
MRAVRASHRSLFVSRLALLFVVSSAAGVSGVSCGAAPTAPIPPLTTAVPTAAVVAPVASATPATPANPFFEASPLLYQAPPFDRIHESDFEPAIEKGMAQHLEEIAAITAQPDPPTFENSVLPMQRSGVLLRRVMNVFGAMTGADTSDALQAIEKRVSPELAAHRDAVYLDAKLWARVKATYEHRASLAPDDAYLTERVHLAFVRAGADLPADAQAELRTLNQEESSLRTDFAQHLLAATKAGALVTDQASDLAGLSPGAIDAAAAAARTRGLDGKWLLALQNTTQQPAGESLTSRAVREKLFRASVDRADHGDANDTRSTVRRLAELRARKAKLLGYGSWAAYVLDDQMAGTPDKALKLLTDVAPAAVAKARSEGARMQAFVDGQRGGFTIAAWDAQYYSSQVKKADLDLDEAAIKPYFELDRVLHDGVFFAAQKLYGVTFQERHDLPVYHPDVRVFEVFDEAGKSFGLFYADYFRRDEKRGGAWMDSFVEASGLLGTHPVVFNVCNFTKPAAGQPALLGLDDVRTMFHEFGHALHGLFSAVKYPALAGTPRDFVEFPSQFNEHWAREPTVFANYARHYQTGAPMPPELAAKIEKSRAFGQGYAVTEAVSAALLDMAWHTLPDGPAPADVDAFEAQALKRYKVDIALVPPRYHTTYFDHIWHGGYSAAYYAYLWSEVLAHDAFRWFEEHGGMTRANGQRFRDMILSRGHTQDLAPMYRAFRGQDPSVEPLLEFRGLAPARSR